MQVLVEPDYADDTKLKYMDDGTDSDYVKQHTLGKAVRSAEDLIVNWSPPPKPAPEPKAAYVLYAVCIYMPAIGRSLSDCSIYMPAIDRSLSDCRYVEALHRESTKTKSENK